MNRIFNKDELSDPINRARENINRILSCKDNGIWKNWFYAYVETANDIYLLNYKQLNRNICAKILTLAIR